MVSARSAVLVSAWCCRCRCRWWCGRRRVGGQGQGQGHRCGADSGADMGRGCRCWCRCRWCRRLGAGCCARRGHRWPACAGVAVTHRARIMRACGGYGARCVVGAVSAGSVSVVLAGAGVGVGGVGVGGQGHRCGDGVGAVGGVGGVSAGSAVSAKAAVVPMVSVVSAARTGSPLWCRWWSAVWRWCRRGRGRCRCGRGRRTRTPLWCWCWWGRCWWAHILTVPRHCNRRCLYIRGERGFDSARALGVD